MCHVAGVDFAIKRMVVGDKNIKLTIWDTAGGWVGRVMVQNLLGMLLRHCTAVA